jgi:fibronectin type 3 domain-containing protein
VLGNLVSATTYYYVITAVNATGEGAASVQVAATTLTDVPAPTVPAVPSGVTAVGGTNQATISWPAVAGAASYNLYRSTTTGVTTSNGTKIAAVSSPYITTGLTAGTTYYFIVSAVNSVGESAASTQSTATTDAPVLAVPAVPTGVTSTGGAKQVSLSWSAVTDATSYTIYWSTTAGVTTSGTKITTTANSYIQTGLTDGTTYYYIVSALNSSGEGVASTQVSAATNAAAQACGSCHAIPPAVGSHAKHTFTSCATCHGAGYSSTTVNAATHMNGTKDVTNSIWNATTRSCASSCHGARSW